MMRLILACIVFAMAGMGAPLYTITEIGTLGGTRSVGRAINASGTVAGLGSLANGAHAVSWNGTLSDLTPLHPHTSEGFGINDAGTVVGHADIDPSFGASRAFYWDGGSMNFYDSVDAVRSWAWDINNNGAAVGTLQVPFVGIYGVMWNGNAAPVPVPTIGADITQALAINDAGEMVGDIQGPGLRHAVLIQGGTVQDLGTLGGSGSTAYGISENGLVVGYSDIASGEYHAFLWDGVTMHDLGALSGGYSAAHGVNSSGRIVGRSYDTQFNSVGVMWEGGTMYKMDDLVVNANGRLIESLWAINDKGQIAGQLRNGMGIRLDPIVNSPEPGAMWLCAAGCALMMARRRS